MTSLNKFPVEGGVILDATTQLNQNFSGLLGVTINNGIRQAIDRASVFSGDGEDIFVEAYTAAAGRNGSVGIDDTTASFYENKYNIIPNIAVVIEATTLNETDFNINNCVCSEIGVGKWSLYCTTGTDEVRRAQIYKTLFYGTNGTNPRASSTYITGITALKTTITRDIGKRAYYFKGIDNSGSATNASRTGTFSNTSTNTNCSSWSNLSATNTSGANVNWQIPAGTVIHSVTQNQTSIRIGTDRVSDELDNPTNCRLYVSFHGISSYCEGIILCDGVLSWGSVSGDLTYTDIDFLNDNSIPVFTEISGDNIGIIHHNIPSIFQKEMTSSFGKGLFQDFETGSSIQYKLQDASTGDTGWLETGEISSFTAITPTKLIVKLIPKATSPTAGYPSIRGFGFLGGN